MSGAVVPGGTVLRIGRCYANHMLVDMAIVRMMQMPVVQVVDMVIVHNAGVAALRTMRMIMIVVLRRVALAHCQVLIKCYLVNIQTPANSCAIDYDKIDIMEKVATDSLPLKQRLVTLQLKEGTQ